MSEKRKKYNLFKDPGTPKRPIILKSDREVSKEPEKDRPKENAPEKVEKPPIILIKARDPSTPKEERPHSPKVQHNDGDGEHNKLPNIEQETKPTPLMHEPVKLLDDQLEFNNTASEFLNENNSTYLVVGILGTQGVGKSMVMNLIAHNEPFENITKHIMSQVQPLDHGEEQEENLEDQLSNLGFGDAPEEMKGDSHKMFKFKMQNMQHIVSCQHCTRGVDMYVTSNRTILLDCEPIYSPSILEEAATAGNLTVRGSSVASIDCLQLASYLMTVCHVLILMQDYFTDYNLLRFIQSAEMLKPSLQNPSGSEGSESSGGGGGGAGGETHPHLLLLHNRCQLEDYTPAMIRTMHDLYRDVFRKSKLQLRSGLYMVAESDRSSLGMGSVCKGLSAEECGAPLNMYLLPEIYEDNDNKDIYRGHPSFERLAARLRWMVHGVSKHQLTNVPNLSEKGWFTFAGKAWENIRKCSYFIEYAKLMP